MALRTRDNIFTEVLVRSNRTTTDSFVTDAMLKSWFFDAHNWASSMYKWPFTEGRVSTTYAGSGTDSDEFYFEGYKSDSFRLITVGGKRLQKLNFADYQIMREEEPEANDRVWSDFGRTVFINPQADVSGTLVAYGQIQPYIDVTDENGLTVFSGYEDEGNDAIVEKMLAYFYSRESPQATMSSGGTASISIMHEQKAQAILNRIWKRILDEQYAYQTHPDRGGMFKRIDVLNGGLSDELFHRDQF